jgi:catechol 2,3-dioxygenase-like lactoylglutathione lyase family enzyme
MRFVNPIPFVTDMARARDFYRDILGLAVRADHGDFVLFETGFALHDGKVMLHRLFGAGGAEGVPYGRDNLVLYFHSDDLEADFARIAPQVVLIHGIARQGWGEWVFRFRDPDGHLVEIGSQVGGDDD